MVSKLHDWLSPVVYLSHNWVSRAGVFLVTSSTVLWIYLLPTIWRGDVEHPYFGILTYLLLPAGFFGGLALIPLGIVLRHRLERRKGTYPIIFAPVHLGTVELRRLLIFIGVTTALNVLIGGHLTYNAITYMDGTTFCGLTCHTVMAPEYTAYQNSPHARVECVKCHIGPGASWFVRSKLSGVPQVLAVTFHTYPTPIPSPVHNLRPARETCEVCHWPQKFEGERLRVIQKYGDDEKNSLTQTVLLLHIGGGTGGPGIHSAHLGPGVTIRYGADERRQKVFWVHYENTAAHRSTLYVGEDTKAQNVNEMAGRTMDCVDCHNRPTHAFDLPERAVDRALAAGQISPSLPFIKKEGVELLKREYRSQREAAAQIPASLRDFYRQRYPDVERQHEAEIAAAARVLVSIYRRNVFPEMKLAWGTHPNNIGHTDFPGCFRCHDNAHASADGKTIPQDCGTCHNLLAVEEPSPKVLTELGLQPAETPPHR